LKDQLIRSTRSVQLILLKALAREYSIQ